MGVTIYLVREYLPYFELPATDSYVFEHSNYLSGLGGTCNGVFTETYSKSSLNGLTENSLEINGSNGFWAVIDQAAELGQVDFYVTA